MISLLSFHCNPSSSTAPSAFFQFTHSCRTKHISENCTHHLRDHSFSRSWLPHYLLWDSAAPPRLPSLSSPSAADFSINRRIKRQDKSCCYHLPYTGTSLPLSPLTCCYINHILLSVLQFVILYHCYQCMNVGRWVSYTSKGFSCFMSNKPGEASYSAGIDPTERRYYALSARLQIFFGIDDRSKIYRHHDTNVRDRRIAKDGNKITVRRD